ncbi:MAG: hypothetical protein ACM3N0_06745 [Chloroflexota bacterium]
MVPDVKAGGWTRVRGWLYRAAEVALPVAGAVALAISGHLKGKIGLFGWEPAATVVMIAIGTLLLLTGAVFVAQRTIPLERLRDEEPMLRCRAELGSAALLRLAQTELRSLARKANYASNERVSLYREEEDGFTLVGRHSARPAFEQSLGRECLPHDEGVLGRAWALGRAAETELPAPGGGSTPNRQWLRAQQQRCKVAPEVATALTMRSQSYVAFRVASDDPKSHGAIIFESTLSLAEAQKGSRPPCLTVVELEDSVKEASGRLSRLLIETRPLARAEIRQLLEHQQGPNPVT